MTWLESLGWFLFFLSVVLMAFAVGSAIIILIVELVLWIMAL